MATQAHCAFCFESLAASLHRRKPPTLPHIAALWDEYQSETRPDEQQDDDAPAPRPDSSDDERSSSEQEQEQGRKAPPHISHVLNARLASSASGSGTSSPAASTSSTPSLQSSASSSGASSAHTRATSAASSRASLAAGKEEDGAAPAASPMFVTWNTLGGGGRGRDKALRGCIGTFEALELGRGLGSYALTAAFDDHRFAPISPAELPTLGCDVTLLTDFEPAAGPLDWTLGTHGLRISFSDGGRRFGATYLPDVAPEQGWSKPETLVSLMRKAGWAGRRDAWQSVADLKVVRYQGRRAGLRHDEWAAFRAWAVARGALRG